MEQLTTESGRHEVHEVSQLALEEARDRLRMLSNILLPHEGELWILDELTEADHQAPWIWSTSLEALQEDLADLLLNNLSTRVGVFGFSIDE